MLIICKIVNIIPKINLFSICLNNNTGLKFMLFVCCKPPGHGGDRVPSCRHRADYTAF